MKLSPDLTRQVLALAGEHPGTPARKKPPAVLPPLEPPRCKLSVGAWLPGLQPVSEANTGGGLKARLRRKAAVKAAVRAAFSHPWILRPPVVVTLHRDGSRLMDSDNLAHSQKAVRDVVAEWLGVDDGDESNVTWLYTQSVAKPVGTYITIKEV